MMKQELDMKRATQSLSMWIWPLVWSLWLSGCFNSSTPTADSETHFLAACGASCGDGLECICGVCTATCVPTRDCSGHHGEASCVPLSAFAATDTCAEAHLPDSLSVCDLACRSDGDCASLSSEHTCERGSCRAPAQPLESGAVSQESCEYDGQTYADGETFRDRDDCNACTCDGGTVACTSKACMQPGEAVMQTTAGQGWQLLAFTDSGSSFTAAAAKSEADLRRMWETVPLDAPAPQLDFDRQVLLMLGQSDTCETVAFRGLQIEAGRVYGEYAFQRRGGPGVACPAVASPAVFLLEVDRAVLPERFILSVAEEDVCRGCDDDSVMVDLTIAEPETDAWWARARWSLAMTGAAPRSSHAYRMIYDDREAWLAILRQDWLNGSGGSAAFGTEDNAPERIEGFTAECVDGGDCIEDPDRIHPTGDVCGIDVRIIPGEDTAFTMTFAEDGTCEITATQGWPDR